MSDRAVEAGPDADRGRAADAATDDSVIVLVGGLGGVVVGLVCTAVALLATGSPWAVGLGVLAWVLSTTYLVRRTTVQEAVSRTGYAVASVLLLVPAVALSPAVSVDGGSTGRGTDVAILFLFVAVPVVLAVGIGWLASRYGA